MKHRNFLLSCVILLAVACILFLVCATIWDLFGQTDTLMTLKVTADCFTLPGVFYVGVTIVGWIGSKGTFDIFGYSIGGLFHLLKREAYDHRAETFYDYRTRKDQNRRPLNLAMLTVGLLFIALGVVFTVIFSVQSA